MSEIAPPVQRQLYRDIQRWGRVWGIPTLAGELRVVFSKRLRTTLARCRPAEKSIVLQHDLSRATLRRLNEVLCHEAAHVATYMLYGSRAKPHGAEWKWLVSLAGFDPVVRTRDCCAKSKPRSRSMATRIFEHRCPVCQMMRIGRRAVPTWRCSECVDAGLNGILVITRLGASPGHSRGG
jgi:predicted SprT family Zn-dependent metalloprotease